VSVDVQTYLWKIPMPPNCKFVVIALADHCHDDGSNAYPSQELLCRKTGLSIQTVRRSLRWLIENDVIILEQKYNQRRSNCYLILLPDGFNRGATQVGQTPRGTKRRPRGATQVGPEVPPRYPNHKEPSLETNVVPISDLLKQPRWIDDQLPLRKLFK
jgi:hypothetical protein